MNETLKNIVKQQFKQRFKSSPMLVFSPGRINLLGEHTDYNQGFVFPAAIDKGIVMALGKTDEATSALVALDKNETYRFSVDQVEPSELGGWENYLLGVVAEVQKQRRINSNFKVVFAGTIPFGAGLSSSAALENALALGLNLLFDLGIPKRELIRISQRAEHNFVGVKCGIMDQYASMFGKRNQAMLLDCKSLQAQYFSMNLPTYTFVLLNTHVKHSLGDSAYNQRREACESVAAALGTASLRDVSLDMLERVQGELPSNFVQKAEYVVEENTRTAQAAQALLAKDYEGFGQLMFATHKGLSEKYEVSCDELDFLVEEAEKFNGVLGARMMGAGFGGCTLNLVHKEVKEDFIVALSQAYQKRFQVALSAYTVQLCEGTRLLDNK